MIIIIKGAKLGKIIQRFKVSGFKVSKFQVSGVSKFHHFSSNLIPDPSET
jgi:nucleoside diphosphate kinase